MSVNRLLIAIFASLLIGVPSISMAQPEAGDRSFSISGTGASDQDFDGNTFGVTGEFGYFHSKQLEYGVRQTFSGVAGDKVSDEWSGATLAFLDYHFGEGKARPFVGVNLGGVYGESVSDSGSAGLEGGLKYYVLPKTYIGFGIAYQFLFSDGDDFDNKVNDGAFLYTLGVGFNF